MPDDTKPLLRLKLLYNKVAYSKPAKALRRWVFWPALAVYLFGQVALVRLTDETPDVLARAGVTPQEAAEITDAKLFVRNPESLSSFLLAATTFDFTHIRAHYELYKNRHADDYPMVMYAQKHSLLGEGMLLDRATCGLSSMFFGSTIMVPSGRLTPLRMVNDMGIVPTSEDFRLPGEMRDYLRLFTLHELFHCEQNILSDEARNEYLADRDAMRFYLARGGNPEVVRAVIHMRIMGAISWASLSPETYDKDFNYAHGPMLYAEFIGGEGRNMTLAEAKEAIRDVIAFLDPNTPIYMRLPLQGHALTVFRQCHEALRFFGPATPAEKASAAPETPGITQNKLETAHPSG